ncbi:ugtP [Symbiodinium pilosum]|uniref:UgtP protein n=1 Tax=Symbiodinium pilosum TaxID=2952 RepID=A0A812XQA9_SYMPI|nr:ugtP [Symbiodinium pilosum]
MADPDQGMVKAIFLVGRGGGGHMAAARALQQCVLDNAESVIDCVEIVDGGGLAELAISGDMLPSGDDIYNYFMQIGFYTMAGMLGNIAAFGIRMNQAAIEEVFEEYWHVKKPSIVVSFVPFLNPAMRTSLLRVLPHCRFVTVITDMANCREHPWIDRHDASAVNHTIVVGNETLESQAMEIGWPSSALLRTSGMIIHPNFYEAKAKNHGATSKTMVIFFGGTAPMRVGQIARKLSAAHPEMEIVVLCGRNAELQGQLQDFVQQGGGRHVVEGFVSSDKVRDYFAKAFCVLGKAGPGVAAEAIACGVPMLIESANVMPQEQPVLDYLTNSGAGLVVKDLENLPEDLTQKVDECRSAIAAMPANNAVFEVANHLDKLVIMNRHAGDLEEACERTPLREEGGQRPMVIGAPMEVG